MKYVYELIGTFFLVFTFGMCLQGPNSVDLFAPLAVGSLYAVMIYAGMHISGGHYNPAISLSAFLRGKIPPRELIGYWIVQGIGACVAALATRYFKGPAAEMVFTLDTMKAFVAEFVFTFGLCYVFLNVCTAKETKNNPFFGFAIGFIVLAGMYAVGSISGGVFNPAIALGIGISEMTAWSTIWVYFLANLLAAACAALIFREAHREKA